MQAEQTLKCYNAPVDTCKVQSVNIENCEQKYAQPVEQFVPHVQAGLRASLPACQEEEHRIVEYYKQTKENYRVIVVQECEVEGAQQPAPVYACHDVLVQGNDKPEYRTVTRTSPSFSTFHSPRLAE